MSLSLPIVLATVVFAGDPARLADAVNGLADAKRLATMHADLASVPHVSGGDGDRAQIARIADAFRSYGLDVEIHRFFPYICKPIDARLEIIGESGPDGGRRGITTLDLRERNLLEDPATAHPELTYGWNAYSGSGDVTGEIVYANYGTRADFQKLAEMNVPVRGKIVLARYGGNFRGYKAKFAEEAGAIGLLIYTDPADSGIAKGPVWPEGTWANDTCVQRGSIITTPWPGDPLTPGVEATESAKRLDVNEVGLPTIPVQPIGYAAAERLMARMRGRDVGDDSWKGGIKVPYRLEGGADLRVHLVVRQERFIGETANVVGTLRGATRPDELVIVGCHHDAWGFGAADPLAGTMVLMECARSFGEAAKAGVRPDRTILFAAWGAEEFGIIGSTEWVESRPELLRKNAVAYINLDMASMGESFGASSSPSLRGAIERAMRRATSPFDGAPIFENWLKSAKDGAAQPSLGDVGGGSDHVGFWCHLNIPSCGLGGRGALGSSYHSNYDTVAWYRKTVGDDYRSALLVTRGCNALVAELADDPLPPVTPTALVRDAARLLRSADDERKKAGLSTDIAPLADRFEAMLPAAERLERGADEARSRGGDSRIATQLRSLLDAWFDANGIPNRPWFKNLYAATDRHSGYAAAMLPLVSEAIEDKDDAALATAVERYGRIADAMASIMSAE